MKIELLKYLAAVLLAISSNTVFAADFVALNFQSNILVTNGVSSYVIDPSAIKVMAQHNGSIMIKVYGTEIWVLMKKTGELEIRKNKLQNSPYFVLAPLRSLEDIDDKIYAVAAMGWPNSPVVRYPGNFCTLCAAPTKIDKISKAKARELLALKVTSRTTASIKN